MDWEIFYTEGSVNSDNCEVENVPTRDVQVIVQPDDRCGYTFQTGDDYYIWQGDRWQGCDKFGMWDYLLEPGWKRVLFGRMLSQKEYQRILDAAKEAWGFRDCKHRSEKA